MRNFSTEHLSPNPTTKGRDLHGAAHWKPCAEPSCRKSPPGWWDWRRFHGSSVWSKPWKANKWKMRDYFNHSKGAKLPESALTVEMGFSHYHWHICYCTCCLFFFLQGEEELHLMVKVRNLKVCANRKTHKPKINLELLFCVAHGQTRFFFFTSVMLYE